VGRELNDCVASVQTIVVFGQLNRYDFSKRIEELGDFLFRFSFQRASKASHVNPVVLLAFDRDHALYRKGVGALMSLLLRTKS
jgi:hypothetical protein